MKHLVEQHDGGLGHAVQELDVVHLDVLSSTSQHSTVYYLVSNITQHSTVDCLVSSTAQHITVQRLVLHTQCCQPGAPLS